MRHAGDGFQLWQYPKERLLRRISFDYKLFLWITHIFHRPRWSNFHKRWWWWINVIFIPPWMPLLNYQPHILWCISVSPSLALFFWGGDDTENVSKNIWGFNSLLTCYNWKKIILHASLSTGLTWLYIIILSLDKSSFL